MEYSLELVHLKLKQLSDKIGSDYFPLPVFLNFFETATLDFVGEKLKIIERTQEVVDDIRTLIPPPKSIPIALDPNQPGKYIAGLPTDYLSSVAFDVIYANGYKCRRADVKRLAEYNSAVRNPNKAPSKDYPIILNYDSLFQIDSGDAAPLVLSLTYCTKPKFATTGQPTIRIVNLPDTAIEKILKITVTNLFNKTGDQRTQSSYQLQEAYRKVFK